MTIKVDLAPLGLLSREQFLQLCRANPELRLEQSSRGEVLIMSPTGGETGRRNTLLLQRLQNWADVYGGYVFDSSTGFRLPNGAQRSPDASWVAPARWEQLSEAERETFPALCPDLVVELLSPSDVRAALQQKMAEYTANGARVGWLIDPVLREVEEWRPASEPRILVQPQFLEDADNLPGLSLSLAGVFPA